ncbi:MAG: hypothetical protein CVV27_11835 [Candidatus Melainabacteria bacterium HGW-Melainabacteria-1]|nr:MAG: hypothetical protein CVV27_11835 [Candidatus Melainabacteria bacterium HGW-Melainabacteria-1]
MSDTQRFRQLLEQIAELTGKHPDYRFEHIDSMMGSLAGDAAGWVMTLDAQWQELSPQRQEALAQIFEHALLRARQATYRPLNALDAFLERQLYGIEDEQIIQKSAVSQALKQYEERRRPPVGQPASPAPASPPVPGRSPAAGRTNPLSPRQLPKGPEGSP